MIGSLAYEYCSYLFIYRRLKPYVWMKTPLPDRVQMNILYFDITGFDNHDENHKLKIGLQWTWNIVDISRSNKFINTSSTDVPATSKSSYEWHNQPWLLVCVPDHVTLHCCVLVLLIRIVRFLIPCYLRSTQVPIYWIVRSIWVYLSCFNQVHRSESDPETALSLVRNPHRHKLVGLNQEADLR